MALAMVSDIGVAAVPGLGADMLRQDLSWFIACVTGLEEGVTADGHPLMFVAPQFSRVVYEGERFLRRQGVPVPFEPRVHEAVVANGRHATKLWERRRTDVADTLVAIREEHHAAFIESVPRFARWLASDLGLFEVDGALLATTHDVHLRLGHQPRAIGDSVAFGQAAEASAYEMGAAASVLAQAVGGDLPEIAVYLAPLNIASRDRSAKDYYPRRFGRALPIGTKELLAMVEGHINTHRLLIAASSEEGPARRAGLITAFHAATSLAQIRDMERGGPSVAPLRDITSEASVKAVLKMNPLRNLCMHYEPQGAAASAATFDEAVNSLAKCSMDALDVTVAEALGAMSEGLRAWEG